MNTIDETGKIKFTKVLAKPDTCLEFLDLQLMFKKTQQKITTDVYSKPTNSFTYVLPSTSLPCKNTKNIPRGIALRLRRICDSDEKFCKRSQEYQNYLVAREYNPTLVKNQFEEIGKINREEARIPKTQNSVNIANSFITTYNPALPDINKILEQHIPILHSNPGMKDLFPVGSFKATYRRAKNLKEKISPSLFPTTRETFECKITKCNKCVICKNYLSSETTFSCYVTGKKYKIKGTFTCKSTNVIYLISCLKCLREQYVGSTEKIYDRTILHISDIHTRKIERCGAAKHFNCKCIDPGKPKQYFKLQIIEQINAQHNKSIDDIMWSREKYWQAEMHTLTSGMNSLNDWYSSKRKGYRK